MKGDESGPFEPALRTSWLEVGAVVLIIAGLGLYDGIRRLRGWVYDQIAEQSVDTAGGPC